MIHNRFSTMLKNLVFLSLIIGCGSSDETSQLKFDNQQYGPQVVTNTWENGAAPISKLQSAKFFSAIAGAVYCGDGAHCGLDQRLSHYFGQLKLNNPLWGWKKDFVNARDFSKDIEAYVFSSETSQDVIIGFRGSEVGIGNGALKDWLKTDFNIGNGWFPGETIKGNVSMGFLEGMYGIWHPNESGLKRKLEEDSMKGKRIWLTGHSHGGAMATLLGALLHERGYDVAGIYIFGTPRIASWEFKESFNRVLGSRTIHIINQQDPFPHNPVNFQGVGFTYQLNGGSEMTSIGMGGVAPWGPGSNLFGRIDLHMIESYVPVLSRVSKDF